MFNHTVASVEFADLVEDLAVAQSKWSQATFGTDEERGPIGPLNHLKLEADEAIAAFAVGGNQEQFTEEMADCLLLVIDASRRGGVGIKDLFKAATEKQKVNESRTWAKPKNDGTDDTIPVEHDANG